jgi:cyclopropane fatty-acyl-phospholipid synthase-like methyltransferase
MIEIWNERYRQPEYAYGILPNEYLKAQLTSLPPGKILFPAEGEGRNAVYAASLGWDCFCFDQSEEAKKKALALAAQKDVQIHYETGDCGALHYPDGSFDAIALIYAHFPAANKADHHRRISGWLKKGGTLIFEAFSKKHIDYNQLNEKVGGPKEVDMLFSIEEIKEYFPGYAYLELEEKLVELNEGLYHIGTGSVIRFLGKKI